MGVLGKREKIERIELPSTLELLEAERDWVDLDVGPLTGGEVEDMDGSTDSDIHKSFVMLVDRIRDWSFTKNDAVTKAEITVGNLRELPTSDITFLVQKLKLDTKGLGKDEKKDSSSI